MQALLVILYIDMNQLGIECEDFLTWLYLSWKNFDFFFHPGISRWEKFRDFMKRQERN